MKPVRLIELLQHPARVPDLAPADWEQVIPQARAASLLARLATRLHESGVLQAVPAAPRQYLISALDIARNHAAVMRWEVACIEDALKPLNVPVVLLKGGAYLMADLPVARGRLFTDLDILVPRDRLTDVEGAMMRSGWATTHLDEYDQRYYRDWMHELPPMMHITRRNVVDIHHAIVPLSSRLGSESKPLLDAAVPLAGSSCLRVLAPADMVIHSAAHLFLEGEFQKGLRDLLDLDGLIRAFSTEPDFFARVLARASELGLQRPLAYALRYSARILDTPIPASVLREAEHALGVAPARALMDLAFTRALRPFHPSCWDTLTPAALWILYLRGHWMRMPLRQLIPHLWRKATTRTEDDDEDTAATAPLPR